MKYLVSEFSFPSKYITGRVQERCCFKIIIFLLHRTICLIDGCYVTLDNGKRNLLLFVLMNQCIDEKFITISCGKSTDIWSACLRRTPDRRSQYYVSGGMEELNTNSKEDAYGDKMKTLLQTAIGGGGSWGNGYYR